MGEVFKFKQFSILQDRCAMKVGTDGVLLGAWASLDHKPNSILDIGAGTGLIALQLAQRSAAETIDAIELDEHAFEQCIENFEASPWSDRLFCYHASFQEFAAEMDESYDLIVSNPPFYEPPRSAQLTSPPKGEKSVQAQRAMARMTSSLPFGDLLKGVCELLSENGQFAVVIPFEAEEEFCGNAKSLGLFPNRITHVRGTSNTPLKRTLLQFSRENTVPRTDELVIEKKRHVYTEAYINLTRDFYLKM